MPTAHQPAASSVEFLRGSTVFSKLPPAVFDQVVAAFDWVGFDQGDVVFSQGDPSDAFFFVVHGRLAITARDREGKDTFVGWVKPGESVGETALLEGETRTATVHASRATVALTLARDRYEALIARLPQSLIVLNHLLATRLRHALATQPPSRNTAEIVAVVAASRDAPLAEFSGALARNLEREGPVLHLSAARLQALLAEDAEAAVVDVEQRGRLLTRLHAQETRHSFILLEADVERTPWTERCLRQADEIVLVARAGARPGAHTVEGSVATPGRSGFERPRRLILVQDDATRQPSGTAAWLDAVPVDDHHHVRLSSTEDMERVGRFVRRRPISVALAGGAALGFAHIGVLRALGDAGIPIDLVCGTSMGSIVGGQVALGRRWDEVERDTRKYFRGNSIYDPTLPAIAFFKATRLDTRLQTMVGDVLIEDLWIKYFCVSSNLTRAAAEVHERGVLKRAMRASSAVPGLFPPILKANGEVLVDGALVNNLPADLAARHGGSVIAVNVIPTVDRVTTGGYQEGVSALRVLLSRRGSDPAKRSPTIVDLLLRGIFLPTVSQASRIRADASLYIEPTLEHFGLLNTRKFDEIVEAGYRAATERLKDWHPSW